MPFLLPVYTSAPTAGTHLKANAHFLFCLADMTNDLLFCCLLFPMRQVQRGCKPAIKSEGDDCEKLILCLWP